MKAYFKLVRDKIPELMEKEGLRPVYRVMSGDSLRIALEHKVIEEKCEGANACSVEETTSEIADLIEVAYALARVEGVSEDALNEIRRIKREEKGGFEKGIFLERVFESGEST